MLNYDKIDAQVIGKGLNKIMGKMYLEHNNAKPSIVEIVKEK